jgi:hypothetical protein
LEVLINFELRRVDYFDPAVLLERHGGGEDELVSGIRARGCSVHIVEDLVLKAGRLSNASEHYIIQLTYKVFLGINHLEIETSLGSDDWVVEVANLERQCRPLSFAVNNVVINRQLHQARAEVAANYLSLRALARLWKCSTNQLIRACTFEVVWDGNHYHSRGWQHTSRNRRDCDSEHLLLLSHDVARACQLHVEGGSLETEQRHGLVLHTQDSSA